MTQQHWIAACLIRLAAGCAPQRLSERLTEEWSADLAEQRGSVARLRFALGCFWAATVIAREHAVEGEVMTARVQTIGWAFARRAATVTGDDTELCDINITPLIDVMLVLLVTLVVSLPLMTHAVKLDLPHALPPFGDPPEVIDLDVDTDGTVVWNGTAVAGFEQLDGYLHAVAQRMPQPEIHLRPDRRAKYEVVARVLAAAQRNRLKKIGFVNTTEFKD
jgi:biopolymer transport protein ExbD